MASKFYPLLRRTNSDEVHYLIKKSSCLSKFKAMNKLNKSDDRCTWSGKEGHYAFGQRLISLRSERQQSSPGAW